MNKNPSTQDCLYLINRGLSLKKKGDFHGALDCYHQGLECVPESGVLTFDTRYPVKGGNEIRSEIWNLIMNIHQDMGNLPKVHEAFQNSIRYNPQNPIVRNDRKLSSSKSANPYINQGPSGMRAPE